MSEVGRPRAAAGRIERAESACKELFGAPAAAVHQTRGCSGENVGSIRSVHSHGLSVLDGEDGPDETLDEFERREAEIAAAIHDAVARFLPEDTVHDGRADGSDGRDRPPLPRGKGGRRLILR